MSDESNVVFASVCITSLYGWIKKLAPLSHATNQKQTKTNCDFLAPVFPRLTLIIAFASISNWFILFFFFDPVVIGLSYYFSFAFTRDVLVRK